MFPNLSNSASRSITALIRRLPSFKTQMPKMTANTGPIVVPIQLPPLLALTAIFITSCFSTNIEPTPQPETPWDLGRAMMGYMCGRRSEDAWYGKERALAGNLHWQVYLGESYEWGESSKSKWLA
ncbi:hypothetical protein RSAG8_06394, partial [Rhizoctonia solani AG-8 WAC10335]